MCDGTGAERKKSGASRPISRVLSTYLCFKSANTLDDHSSGALVAKRLKQPTRTADLKTDFRRRLRAPGLSLFGLAPGGVYHAATVTGRAVRSYRTLSPLPHCTEAQRAVCFLWHFPWGHPRRPLTATVSSRSPDFPPPDAFDHKAMGIQQRSPGRLAPLI